MPYRTDLKRPDLKGQFPCSVCNKIFCHSSSLSRHRMQAHYKSYICTQCNQEIHSSETLRSHMYRFHQIQRMFMCRCCNWAFPDKTSLHIHMQSMQKSGKPGDVSVLARSSLDSKELMTAFEAERARSLRSSTNSSPDEEQTFRCESVSPLTNESNKEQRQHKSSNSDSDKHTRKGYLKNNKQKSADPIPNNQQYLNNNNRANNFTGIFPNHVEQPKQQDLHIPKLGVKMESETACAEGGNGAQLTTQQQQLMAASALLQQQPTPLQQQWFSQLLANNPYFWSPASLDPKGITTAVHHQQQNVVSSLNNKLLQTVYAAVASAAANNRATMEFQQQQLRISHQQQQMPPQKKLRKSEKSKANEVTNPTQFATSMDLSLQIPNHQNNNVTDTTIKIVQGVSPAMSDGSSGKLNSLISNLLSIRSAESRSGSPAGEEDCDGKFDSSDSLSERKNKRKLRTPTRAEMAEIIYDDEPEICGTMLSQCSTENLGPSIQRLMENQQYHKINSGEQVDNQGNNQQPSPAVSDSQTSGSSGVHLEGELASPKKCFCQAKLFDSNERLKCVNRSKEIPHQNAKQIRLLTDRVALLAGSLQEEAHAKEELIRCAHLIAELCDR